MINWKALLSTIGVIVFATLMGVLLVSVPMAAILFFALSVVFCFGVIGYCLYALFKEYYDD